jgi:hypothetical protein
LGIVGACRTCVTDTFQQLVKSAERGSTEHLPLYTDITAAVVF